MSAFYKGSQSCKTFYLFIYIYNNLKKEILFSLKLIWKIMGVSLSCFPRVLAVSYRSTNYPPWARFCRMLAIYQPLATSPSSCAGLAPKLTHLPSQSWQHPIKRRLLNSSVKKSASRIFRRIYFFSNAPIATLFCPPYM